MRTSDSIIKLAEALAAAQGAFTLVPRTKTGTFHRHSGEVVDYKYADLADVLKMALPVLSKNGLAITQPLVMVEGKLRLVTRLMHVSGEWMESDGLVLPEGLQPQEFASVQTYWRRYDASSLLSIASDEDLDGVTADNAKGKGGKSSAPAKRPPQSTAEARPRRSCQLITSRQVKRLWGIAHDHGWAEAGVHNMVVRYGYSHVDNITRDQYDQICAELALRQVPPKTEQTADGTLPF